MSDAENPQALESESSQAGGAGPEASADPLPEEEAKALSALGERASEGFEPGEIPALVREVHSDGTIAVRDKATGRLVSKTMTSERAAEIGRQQPSRTKKQRAEDLAKRVKSVMDDPDNAKKRQALRYEAIDSLSDMVANGGAPAVGAFERLLGYVDEVFSRAPAQEAPKQIILVIESDQLKEFEKQEAILNRDYDLAPSERGASASTSMTQREH